MGAEFLVTYDMKVLKILEEKLLIGCFHLDLAEALTTSFKPMANIKQYLEHLRLGWKECLGPS